ncbi:discoidin domain-containing protein [bacterium]|nr:discoidin domain-containing protein [bacterium]
MGEISGVSTDNIDNVDGFFPTQGSGGTATTAPSITVTTATTSITVTIDNHDDYDNPNYSVISKVGGTTVVADADVNHTLESGNAQLSDTITFEDTNSTSGQRTVEVRAQDFGNEIQSAATTATYDVTDLIPVSRYIRIRGVNSDGSDSNKRMFMSEMRFYESSGQSGTSHPTNMVSNTVDSSGNSYYTISAGHQYSSYNSWEAFDDNGGGTFDAWWSLGTTAANNWIQVKFDSTQFSTPPQIQSFSIQGYADGTYVDYIAIETSSDGTNFTQRAVYAYSDSSNSTQNFP